MTDKREKGSKKTDQWLKKFTDAHFSKISLRKEDSIFIIPLFFRRANDRYLRKISEDKEPDAIAEFLNFINIRKNGDIKIRVIDAVDFQDGLSERMAALETCMVDQRFIIDTIKLCIAELGLREEGGVHFSFPVQRDSAGKLTGVSKKEDDNHRLESVSRFLLSGFRDEKHKEEFIKELQERLNIAVGSVRDYQRFRKNLRDQINSYEFLAQAQKGDEAEQLKEANEVIEWLLDNNFIFVSLLQVDGKKKGAGKEISNIAGYQIIKENDSIVQLAHDFFYAPAGSSRVMMLRKSKYKSPIKSAGLMDMVLMRQFDEDGEPNGGIVLLGLLTHKAMALQRSGVPYLKNRLQKIMEQDEVRPQSSSYNARLKAFNTLMIEYLFECEDRQLRRLIDERLDQEELNEASAHIDIQKVWHSVYALLAIPLEAYSDNLLESIQNLLKDELVPVHVQVELEAAKGQIIPLAFYLSECSKLDHDEATLERKIVELCTTWQNRFRTALTQHFPENAGLLYAKYAEAFSDSYRQHVSFDEIMNDIVHLEKLQTSGSVQFDFIAGKGKHATTEVLLRFYRADGGLLLSDILPIFHNFGFSILDEVPEHVAISSQLHIHINTFRLIVDSNSGEVNFIEHKKRLINGLEAVFSGKVPSDPMNRLMLKPGLTWEDVDILRSYMRYSMQIWTFIDTSIVDRILYQNSTLTQLLIEYFHSKFDPAVENNKPASRNNPVEKTRSAFLAALDKIQDATEDHIFRVFLNLIDATLRTNAFRTDRAFHYLSFKFECAVLDRCPEPRPLYEIFVHHAEMEGCHLRSGRVARGGIRWSDRLDDYRTEIFGLMRAQKSKNVLIVPGGAKGGYIIRGTPKKGQTIRAYADEMYKVLIRGMLDLTDNQLSGKEIRPPQVVCHDGFDPYLVVAADKGTAHLSDTANALSAEYNFWLDDAFASGGSAGYDHKVEGITAKGAWVCVRHHFGKINIDPEKDVIRVVGIGDMSGDVFGNGMLRSKTIKLVGAFNHAHIFLDPDPDCEKSFNERQRMFNLPRSSWTDYDSKIISKGGGIFPRQEKSIALTPELQTLLGTKETKLSPEEVIRKLLALDVDLIYNGGLGTYIKSSKETHAEVGDKSNDALRVNGCDVRAKVIGEGGNLGVTQKGRIEYALKGGFINTDAIDNSGGVDCSDREVNLKILFGPLINDGKMKLEERNKILKSLTPEVLSNILNDNHSHALCLSLDEIRSQKDPYTFLRTTDFLAEKGIMNAQLENLPSQDELQQRGLKKGFTRPELSKLMAFFKMYAKSETLNMEASRFPLRNEFLKSYFPKFIYDNYRQNMKSHILIRELLATLWIGHIINDAGASLLVDLVTDAERSILDVAFAYTAVEQWMNAEELKRNIMACKIPLAARLQAIVAVEEGIKIAASWILHFLGGETLYQKIGDGQDFSNSAKPYVKAFDSALKLILPDSTTFSGQQFIKDVKRFEELQFEPALARQIAASAHWSKAFPVAHLAEKTGKPSEETAQTYFYCGQTTGMQGFLTRIAGQSSLDKWEAQALKSLRASMLRTLLTLSEKALHLGIDDTFKREPYLKEIGTEVAHLQANPSDPVPVPLLVVMGEKLHKAVNRLNTGGAIIIH